MKMIFYKHYFLTLCFSSFLFSNLLEAVKPKKNREEDPQTLGSAAAPLLSGDEAPSPVTSAIIPLLSPPESDIEADLSLSDSESDSDSEYKTRIGFSARTRINPEKPSSASGVSAAGKGSQDGDVIKQALPYFSPDLAERSLDVLQGAHKAGASSECGSIVEGLKKIAGIDEKEDKKSESTSDGGFKKGTAGSDVGHPKVFQSMPGEGEKVRSILGACIPDGERLWVERSIALIDRAKRGQLEPSEQKEFNDLIHEIGKHRGGYALEVQKCEAELEKLRLTQPQDKVKKEGIPKSAQQATLEKKIDVFKRLDAITQKVVCDGGAKKYIEDQA